MSPHHDQEAEELLHYPVENGYVTIPLNASIKTAQEQYYTDPVVRKAVEIVARRNETTPRDVIGRRAGFSIELDTNLLGVMTESVPKRDIDAVPEKKDSSQDSVSEQYDITSTIGGRFQQD